MKTLGERHPQNPLKEISEVWAVFGRWTRVHLGGREHESNTGISVGRKGSTSHSLLWREKLTLSHPNKL